MTNTKLGLVTLGKYIVSMIMCFLVTFSFIAIFTMATIDMIGYEAAIFENEDATEPMETYEHYYSDGDDVKKVEAEKKGYIVNTREIAEEFSGTPYIICHILSQAVSLILFVALVSNKLNTQGRFDRNAVNCGRAEEDKLRGLKAGLFPTVFSLLSWGCLVLAKFGMFKLGLTVYSFANYHFFGFQKLIFGGTANVNPETFGVGVLLLALIPAVVTLVVCTVSYWLGYRDISLYEKAVYKK